MIRHICMSLTLGAAALAPAALATEAAMNQALTAWQNRLKEYHASVEQAPTPEAKAAVTAPDGMDIAPALWQSISGVTATRQEEVRGKKGEKQLRTMRNYEFEEIWAAPGVVWFINHPAALAAVIGADKPKLVTSFTNALLQSLRDTHYSAPAVADVCATLASGTSVDEYDTLEKIYTRNQDTTARACAAMGLSLMLNNPMVSGVAGSDTMVRGKRLYYLKQALLLSKDDTRFGDAPLTDVAAEQTYRLRRLSPGCVPPQLRVRDAQGKECLFPQPGKKHLLFFWTPQESVGAGLMARLKGLQQQYPDMELCPIAPAPATDEEEAALREAAGETGTYTDDSEGTAGRDYRIEVVPTAVLLDEKSTILYIGYPDMKLRTALEAAEPRKQEEKHGTIIIKDGIEDAPVLQPGSTPKPANGNAADTPPDLREIPDFT